MTPLPWIEYELRRHGESGRKLDRTLKKEVAKEGPGFVSLTLCNFWSERGKQQRSDITGQHRKCAENMGFTPAPILSPCK